MIVTIIMLELIMMQDHFNISDGIDGSANSYNITYTDAVSQIICASVEILASSCSNGICEHEFRIFSSECASSALHIVVAVAGANVLGTGRPSFPVKVSGI
jgi:hypothetical protein